MDLSRIAQILGVSTQEIKINIFAGVYTREEIEEDAKEELWWNEILHLPESVYHLRNKHDWKMTGKLTSYEKRFLVRYKRLFRIV